MNNDPASYGEASAAFIDGEHQVQTAMLRALGDALRPGRDATQLTPGALLMGVEGYPFGLGFMVRQGPVLATVPGSEGEFMWAGAGGTFFFDRSEGATRRGIHGSDGGSDPAGLPEDDQATGGAGDRALINLDADPRVARDRRGRTMPRQDE
jgi:hypothetical protein